MCRCPALVLCVLASWPARRPGSRSSAPDEAAIREVVRNYVDASDKRDRNAWPRSFRNEGHSMTFGV